MDSPTLAATLASESAIHDVSDFQSPRHALSRRLRRAQRLKKSHDCGHLACVIEVIAASFFVILVNPFD